ncbi:MAG: hypothetical protein ACTIJ6_11435 [Leucobacter sp.]
MSDERETPAIPDPGAPVEEQSVSDTAVQDAVERAAEVRTEGVADDTPDAANTDAANAEEVDQSAAADSAAAEQAHREEFSKVDTELNLERPTAPIVASDMPTAAAPAATSLTTPERDGEIRISSDHPMAALYMQSPMPPDLKGNRAAGVAIALLATLAFAVLYAAIVSAWIAPFHPPSSFLTEGLLPWVTSWGFIVGVVAFFLGLVVLVLVFGRAGWWAYVIFSLFVGVVVWAATSGTFAYVGTPMESATELRANGLFEAIKGLAFTVPTLGAAVIAREVAVWFGAWIGARGRKVKARNAKLLKEYEVALAEVRAQQ